MDHSQFIIITFRLHVFNYIKYNITCHKIFSAVLLHKTAFLIFYPQKSDFVVPQVIAVLEGSNSIMYYGLNIYSLAPKETKYRDY